MKVKFTKLSAILLVTIFLASMLFMSSTGSMSGKDVTNTTANPTASGIGYDPWADINDDGIINIKDASQIGARWMATGTPLTKAYIAYDSGWVNITDKCRQYFNVTHNLSNTDVMVDIQGKTTSNGGMHQKYLGLTDYKPGWSRTYGNMIGSAARRLTQTRDGGFAFAGDVASLIKTDSIGNILWNKTFGPARVSYTVVQTSDGGYAIAGEYYITSSNRDFWLVKTDVDGNKQWEKMYGGAGTEWASSMVQTSDGGYAMAGITNSFGANFDGWLVKTNSTGNIEWSRTYGGALSDDFRSVVQTKDGGYVMAGETEISVGLSQIWLVKTDSNGNMQWNYSYDQGMALEVIQTADGGYAMPGALGSVNLVKTDANGIVQWKRRYSEFDGAYSIVGTSDGGYALAGYKYHSGNSAFSFVKTDVSGNIQWSQTYDSPEQDFASSMVQTSDGGFAIIGEAGSSIWLVKTDVEYGLAWTDSTVDTVTLYRGATDPYWNFVRVRIWEPKTP